MLPVCDIRNIGCVVAFFFNVYFRSGLILVTFNNLWAWLKHDRLFAVVSRLQAGQPWSRGSIPGGGKKFFFSPECPDRLWDPPSLLFNGCLGRLRREADHIPPSSGKVKNERSCTTSAPYVFTVYTEVSLPLPYPTVEMINLKGRRTTSGTWQKVGQTFGIITVLEVWLHWL